MNHSRSSITRATTAPVAMAPVAMARAAMALALFLPLVLASCSEPSSPSGPEITSADLDDAIVGEPYSAGISATGGDGDYSWEVVSGGIPPGLAANVEDLADNDLLITGTAEEVGSFTFTVRVEDGRGQSDQQQITLVVRPVPGGGVIATPALAPALAGFTYQVVLRTLDTIPDFTWTVVEGSLPAGLTLRADGQFQGTPETTDTVTFTVQAESSNAIGRESYTLRVVRDEPSRFNITAFAVVDVPPSLEDNLAEAIRRWEAAIVGDLPAAMTQIGLFDPPDCGGFGQLVEGAPVDDILIMVNIDSIDGVRGVLAQAGPCVIRSSTLPVAGILTLDETDLKAALTEEWVTDIIQHEMGHVLGIGALWELMEILEGRGTDDPRYTGAEAVSAYQAAGGADAAIPVENEGGAGTRDSHWREAVFGSELMTGFAEAEGVNMFLSRMSIASLADLGYTVDLDAADSGTLLPAIMSDGHRGDRAWRDIVGVGPIRVTPDSVRPTPVPGGTP